MTEPLEVHRSLIEFITSELPAREIGWRRYMAIRPIVVDANVLASDVFFVAQRGRDSALQDLSGFGTGRLFTSSHIYSKVYARLPKLAASGGRGKFLQAAINIWEQRYLPRIRFVDVSDMHPEDPRIMSITDQEDQPVATVAALLAPSVLLSEDRHLRGLGVAGWNHLSDKNWRHLAVAGNELANSDRLLWTAGVGVGITAEVAKSVWRILRAHPYLALAVAMLVAAGSSSAVIRVAKADRAQLKETLGEAFALIGKMMQDYMARHAAAQELLDQGTIVEAGQRTPLQDVAHVLAVSPRPLLMREIVEALSASQAGPQLRTADVSAILWGHRAFLRDAKGRWIVGGYIRPRRVRSLNR
jgi:hypothetical protein